MIEELRDIASVMTNHCIMMEIERPKRGTSNDIMSVYDKSVLDMFKYKGKIRLYANDDQVEIPTFTIEKLVKPGASNKDTVWNVILDNNLLCGSPDLSQAWFENQVKATVKRHCTIHGEKAGNNSDILSIDEVLYAKIQIFPAWITLAGFDYEINIIKSTNGKTEFSCDVVTSCDDQIRAMLEQTAAWYVKRNPIGQIGQITE